MKIDILGMEMFDELVAEDDVGARIRQIERKPVIDEEPEISGRGRALDRLIGNIDADHGPRHSADAIGEGAIARRELDEIGFRSDEPLDQSEFFLIMGGQRRRIADA